MLVHNPIDPLFVAIPIALALLPVSLVSFCLATKLHQLTLVYRATTAPPRSNPCPTSLQPLLDPKRLLSSLRSPPLPTLSCGTPTCPAWSSTSPSAAPSALAVTANVGRVFFLVDLPDPRSYRGCRPGRRDVQSQRQGILSSFARCYSASTQTQGRQLGPQQGVWQV